MSDYIKNKADYLMKLSQYILKECREFNPITIRIPKNYVRGDFTVKTDGKTVRAGDKFFELSLPDQIHKMLHICLHVSLRHHHRAREIYDNPFAVQVWNLSTDTLINNAIKDYVKEKVRDADSFSTAQFNFSVVQNIVEESLSKNVSEMSSEQVFSHLLKHTDKQEIDLSQLQKILEDLENEFSKEDFPESAESLQAAGLENENSDSKVQDLIWSERLRSAMKQAGQGSANFLVNLENDLPKVKIHWTKLLKQFLTSRLMLERESNWKRPSRRFTAGTTDIYEPYRDRKKGIKRLALCWDISGSCFDQETINKFVANIEAIHKSTACELVLIPFDTQVKESNVYTLTAQDSFSQVIKSRIKVEGGGGTDLRAPIDYANSINPTVIVVLTDCYQFGEWPAPSRYPTLWASTGDSAPWGKTIIMED